MNRSILLVICDFFILTLLSFVQIDGVNQETSSQSPAAVSEVSGPAMTNMVATLTAALELERRERQSLTNALAMTSAELQERRRVLEERERNLAATQERLSATEVEARRLAEERARLERGEAEAQASIRTLRQAFETTQQGAVALQERLADSARVEAETKAKAEQMAQELARREREARDLQDRLAKLDASREVMREEKQKLELNLRERETEVRMTRGEVAQLNQQLTVAQTEKAQLAQTAASLSTNVGALAEKSAAIQEEIERQRRFSANAIFADFLSNRVEIITAATTRGALGQEVDRERAASAVLVQTTEGVFAVLHVESTALRLWPPEAPWTAFAFRMTRGSAESDAPRMSLVREDPRVVLVPVSPAQVTSLGARVFGVAPDPSVFPDAVVVGVDAKYYGEASFRINRQAAAYVDMERSTFRRLFGEFAPRKGDLVFTKTGLFLGVMVDGERCWVARAAETLPSLRTGTGLGPGEYAPVLKTAFETLEKQGIVAK